MKEFNAAKFDGEKNVFDWSGNKLPEGFDPADLALLKDRSRQVSDLLSRVVAEAKSLVATVDKSSSLIESMVANGYDYAVNLPPFPLEGTLAPLRLADLASGLVVEAALQRFMRTPFNVNEGIPDATPRLETPLNILRRIAG